MPGGGRRPPGLASAGGTAGSTPRRASPGERRRGQVVQRRRRAVRGAATEDFQAEGGRSCHLCKSRKTIPVAGRAAPGTAGGTSQPSPTEPATLAQVLLPAELVTVRRVELSQQKHPCQRNYLHWTFPCGHVPQKDTWHCV